MDKDSASGTDRAGVRWLLLIADNQLRACPEFSGLELLSLVVQKIVAGEFSFHTSHILSAAILIPIDKGAGRGRPIAIGNVLRRLAT